MGCRQQNIVDDTVWEFPRWGFVLLHLVGAMLLFTMGVRYAARRAPLPLIVYRALRMLLHR